MMTLPSLGTAHGDVGATGRKKITDAQLRAALQALKDEVYDRGYETDYEVLEAAPGARIPVYVDPYLVRPGVGNMIYKLMPFGEIERYFEIRRDGVVVLYGDPAKGFPPNGGPSMKTVYLPDHGVFHAKLSWIKRYVTILFHPPAAVVLRAAQRQKERMGFSYYLSGKDHSARTNRPSSK